MTNEEILALVRDIRNILPGIKVYAQLLPERYADAEFRSDFAKLVQCETDNIDRLAAQIEQALKDQAPESKAPRND